MPDRTTLCHKVAMNGSFCSQMRGSICKAFHIVAGSTIANALSHMANCETGTCFVEDMMEMRVLDSNVHCAAAILPHTASQDCRKSHTGSCRRQITLDRCLGDQLLSAEVRGYLSVLVDIGHNVDGVVAGPKLKTRPGSYVYRNIDKEVCSACYSVTFTML